MIQFNILDNTFNEDEVLQSNVVIITWCNYTNKNTITLIESDYTILCLHNENEDFENIALELFKLKDIRFKEFLSFFNEKEV